MTAGALLVGTSLQPVETLSPGGDLNAYIQGVYSIPVLTVEEEQGLLEPIMIKRIWMLHVNWCWRICVLSFISLVAIPVTGCRLAI